MNAVALPNVYRLLPRSRPETERVPPFTGAVLTVVGFEADLPLAKASVSQPLARRAVIASVFTNILITMGRFTLPRGSFFFRGPDRVVANTEGKSRGRH